MIACLNESDARTVSKAVRILESSFQRSTENPYSANEFARVMARLSIASEPREVFMAFWLNAKHQLISYEILGAGTLTSCYVYPREVVKAALAANAASVIFAHNHPSGEPKASVADMQLTETLRSALKVIDVSLYDHLVVTPHSFDSIAATERMYAEIDAMKAERAKKAARSRSKAMKKQ